MSINLIGHQPIDFTYGLDGYEDLSDYCLKYQTGDRPMFQFKNTADGCGVLIGIRNKEDGSGFIQLGDFTISGEYISVTIDFNSLGLEAGCYEIALYEICTQYGSNLVVNGTFNTNLSGWSVVDKITLSLTSITYESYEGANDGSITLSVSGGTGPFTYSKNGVTFQGSTTFTGLTARQYTFTAKDANSLLGQTTINMEVAADCSSLGGSSAYSLIGFSANNLKNCEAFELI